MQNIQESVIWAFKVNFFGSYQFLFLHYFLETFITDPVDQLHSFLIMFWRLFIFLLRFFNTVIL